MCATTQQVCDSFCQKWDQIVSSALVRPSSDFGAPDQDGGTEKKQVYSMIKETGTVGGAEIVEGAKPLLKGQ